MVYEYLSNIYYESFQAYRRLKTSLIEIVIN